MSSVSRVWASGGIGSYDQMVVAGGLVIVDPSKSDQRGLMAVGAVTGAPVWKRSDVSASGLAAAGDTVFVAGITGEPGQRGTLVAMGLDLATGRTRWSKGYADQRRTAYAAVAATAGKFFVARADGTVQAFRQSDGTLVWSSPGKYINGVVVSGQWLLTTEVVHGVLFPVGLDAATGRKLWRHTGRSTSATPSVIDGRIVVIDDGQVSALPFPDCRTRCTPSWTKPQIGSTTDLTGRVRAVSGFPGFVVVSREVSEFLGRVEVRDSHTGRLRWMSEGAGGVRAVVAGSLILGLGASSGGMVLQAWPVDGCGRRKCAPLWQKLVGPYDDLSALSVARGRLFFMGTGGLHGYAAGTLKTPEFLRSDVDEVDSGGGLTAVSPSPGRSDLFGVSSDFTLAHRSRTTGRWSDWEDLGGGSLRGTPAVVSSRPGELDVFVNRRDGALMRRAFRSGRWTAWTRLPVSGVTGMAAAAFPDGTMSVIAGRGGVQDAQELRFDGSWGAPQDIPGTAGLDDTNLAAVAGPGGSVDLFGINGAPLVQLRRVDDRWGRPETVRGSDGREYLAGPMSAIRSAANAVELVFLTERGRYLVAVTVTAGSAAHRRLANTDIWFRPAAAISEVGRIDVYGVAVFGAVTSNVLPAA